MVYGAFLFEPLVCIVCSLRPQNRKRMRDEQKNKERPPRGLRPSSDPHFSQSFSVLDEHFDLRVGMRVEEQLIINEI